METDSLEAEAATEKFQQEIKAMKTQVNAMQTMLDAENKAVEEMDRAAEISAEARRISKKQVDQDLESDAKDWALIKSLREQLNRATQHNTELTSELLKAQNGADQAVMLMPKKAFQAKSVKAKKTRGRKNRKVAATMVPVQSVMASDANVLCVVNRPRRQ